MCWSDFCCVYFTGEPQLMITAGPGMAMPPQPGYGAPPGGPMYGGGAPGGYPGYGMGGM